MMNLNLGLKSKLLRGNRFQLLKNNLKSKQYLNVGCGNNLHKEFINLDYSYRPTYDRGMIHKIKGNTHIETVVC